MIYNDDRMLAEYLHTFINTFRQREVLSVILNVPDQTPPLVLRIWTRTARTWSTGARWSSSEVIQHGSKMTLTLTTRNSIRRFLRCAEV